MGKKKNKNKDREKLTNKTQAIISDELREFFLNGCEGPLPASLTGEDYCQYGDNEEEAESNFLGVIAAGLGLGNPVSDIEESEYPDTRREASIDSEPVYAFQSMQHTIGMMMTGPREVPENNDVVSHYPDITGNEYEENNDIEDDDPGRDEEPGVGNAPFLPSSELNQSKDTGALVMGISTNNSVESFRNNMDTLFFVDRERGFCIDIRELSVNSESQYIPTQQVTDSFKFLLLNARPDTIFTVDEFRKKIVSRFESIDEEAYVFIKDHDFIFAYHVDESVYEGWEVICDELRSTGKLYDFLNTFSKKCSSKHFRMNHSKAYINFWLENQMSDDGTVSNDQEYYVSLMSADEFNEDWDNPEESSDAKLSEYHIIDYWDFFDKYRTNYFAKASSEYSNPSKVFGVSEEVKEVTVKTEVTVSEEEAPLIVTCGESNDSDNNSEDAIKIDTNETEPTLSDDDFDDESMAYGTDEPSTVFNVHRRQN